MSLIGTVQLSPPDPRVTVAKRLATYTLNGAAGGVIDVASGGTIPCNAGDVVGVTVIDVSAGGVSSLPSPVLSVTAIDTTTVPATPTVLGITFAVAPTPLTP